MEKLQFFYKHTKTGNIYEYKGRVFDIGENTTKDVEVLTAHCSENKEHIVNIYKIGTKFFYASQENEGLHDAGATKILYERDGVLWLRSEDAFYEIIDIDGQRQPRFKKVDIACVPVLS